MFKGFAALLTLLLSGFVLGQSIQVPVEVYAKLPQRSMMSVSPSGNRLAYRDTSSARDMLVVVGLKESKIIAGAEIKDVNPDSLYFVDEDIVIMVATTNSKIGGYRGRHDLSWAYAFNIQTKKLQSAIVSRIRNF